MDDKWSKWCSILRDVQAALFPAGASSSSSPKAAEFQASSWGAEKINDHVYSIHSPLPNKRPSVEIVFFHGLQLEESEGAHLTTWLSKDKTQLWLDWILKVEGLSDARILAVSYDAHARTTDKAGLMDGYVTAENLVQSLVEGEAQVGQDGCPVILVGHCLGGLIMKEVCVQAHRRVTERRRDPLNERLRNFLDSVRGLCFYATPHHGTRLTDIGTDKKGPLFKTLTILDEGATRLNASFQFLREIYEWKSVGVQETRPVNLEKYNYKGLVVEEGSARHDVDYFYTASGTNHFDICRPESTKSSSFLRLMDFITDRLKEDKDRQGPELTSTHQVVGVDHQVKTVRDRLAEEPRLGIFGLGGIGKTTLAKSVFNAISKDFEYACFLLEVNKHLSSREHSEILRAKIKENLYFRGRLVSQEFECNRLDGKKVLIMLDDVKEGFQLEMMNHIAANFADERRIFVTTRNREFLTAEGFQAISVATLRDEDARNLFCTYAFEEQQRGFEDLVERFVDKCGGYPLALEISGKYLCGQPEKIWHEVLQKLSNANPINGGKTDAMSLILDSSYRDLGTEARQMFLDVAHCFDGQRLSTVKEIWKLYRWGAETGWRALLDRGLVTEVPLKSSDWGDYPYVSPDSTYERDSETAIQMHELVRDYGKTNEELCPEPEKLHSSHSQVCPMEIWKIGFDDSKFNILQEMDDSENPSRDGARSDGASHSIPRELHSLNVEYLHRWIFSRIDKAISQKNPTLQLEIMNCSSLAFLPKSLGQLRGLQHLTIEKCRKLESIPESLGLLRVLDRLELQGCDTLRRLPESFGMLRALQHLSIGECKSLRFLPESLGELHCLENFMIKGCHSLGYLPDSLGQLCALQHLSIWECEGLRRLPDSLGQLHSLEYLTIRGCHGVRYLPDSLGQLCALQRLSIGSAKA